MTEPRSGVLLQVRDLATSFYTGDGVVKAVDGVTFSVEKGTVLGIVGESGCGKTMTALSIMRLIPQPPGRIVGGRIFFDGRDLLSLPEREMQKIRGKRIAMVFQEPMTSLNPVFTVGEQIAEMLRLHLRMSRSEAREKTIELLDLVGIPLPDKRVKAYPHQLSGGMRQRVMIAMAISCQPDLIIADEPTTALDVTIQAQILQLLTDLRKRLGMAMILITHDLGVIAEVADHVAIMYAGKIVEYAPTMDLFETPLHPYTIGLMKSLPRFSESTAPRDRLSAIPGTVPRLSELPPGCKFSPRCGVSIEVCGKEDPTLEEIQTGHGVRCWLHRPSSA